MSQLISTYDPNVPPAGQNGDSFVTNYLSNGIGSLVMWNNSDWEQDITFPNGDSDVLPAWTAAKFLLQGPSGQVQWAQDTQLASINATPISQVKVVAYRENEPVPGVYPVALVRQTVISNQVNANVTGSANIDNEGNVAGTSLIKSIVAGDGTNQAVSLTNDAVFVLGDTANPGSMTAAGKITAKAAIEVGTLDAPADHNSYIAVTGSGATQNTRIQSGSVVDIQIPGGTTTWEFSGNDIRCNNGGAIHLNIGQLKDLNSGSGSFTAGTHVVNHGLSGVPAVVMGVCSDSVSTGTFSIPDASYTSTQFTIINGSGVTLRISWLAYR